MRRLHPVITVVSVLLAFPLSAADAPVSEAWYVYMDKQVPYGTEHVLKRTLANGHIEHQIETRVLIDLLGNRQEESTSATYVVTHDLRPVSLHVRGQRASGEFTITGAIEGEHFVLRREANGLQRSAALNLQPRPLFRALLPEALSRLQRGSGAGEITQPVIDEEFLSIEVARCRQVGEHGSPSMAWMIEVGSEVVLSKGRLTLKDGERETEESAIPRFTLRRCSRPEAEQITHRKLMGREILTFEVDQPIMRVDRLQELTVKLRWKEIPLDRLHLSDARQVLLSHRAEGSQHEAVVRIGPPASSTLQADETLGKEDRDRLLAKTRFIDPTDPDIVSRAQEWTKNSTTPREAVIALAENVFQHLQGGELIAETLSGPEVLKCRKGKCSEHAVLFASLARSRGIPTRIVLGDRMVGSRWIGHMWNEAFIEDAEVDRGTNPPMGRWVTVDTTAQEVGFTPALLKFTHSDSVSATQPLRWELTDSLEVSIANYNLLPENLPEAWKTGIVGNSYTSGEFGFRVSTPDKDWRIAPELTAGQLVMRLHVPGEKDVQIHCVAFALPAAIEAKTLMTIRSTRFLATYQDYKRLDDKAETINGRDWQKLQFTRAPLPQEAKRMPDGKLMKTTEYAFHQGKVGYLINLISEESAHDRHLEQLQRIVKSVVFKDGPP